MDIIKKLSFEDFSHDNGFTYWWATDLCNMLNYANLKSFEKVIERGRRAIEGAGIDPYINIVLENRNVDGKSIRDFKLSRFACYIIIMNASSSKSEVASAQTYFAQKARELELIHQGKDQIDRIVIRDELSEGQKSLNSVAKGAELFNYAYFQQAGFRGLYNMFNTKLADIRGVKKEKLYDTMGRTELAANLFRITQTEERIKNQNIQGQTNLEDAHFEVGREVRNIVIKNVGIEPENLPQEKRLQEVKKEIKKTQKKFLKEDTNKKK